MQTGWDKETQRLGCWSSTVGKQELWGINDKGSWEGLKEKHLYRGPLCSPSPQGKHCSFQNVNSHKPGGEIYLCGQMRKPLCKTCRDVTELTKKPSQSCSWVSGLAQNSRAAWGGWVLRTSAAMAQPSRVRDSGGGGGGGTSCVQTDVRDRSEILAKSTRVRHQSPINSSFPNLGSKYHRGVNSKTGLYVHLTGRIPFSCFRQLSTRPYNKNAALLQSLSIIYQSISKNWQ